MNSLIKALQAGQNKQLTGEMAKDGVPLELMPRHATKNLHAQPRPAPAADSNNILAPASAAEAHALLASEPALGSGGQRAWRLGLGGLALTLLCASGYYFYLQSLPPAEIIVPRPSAQPLTTAAVAAPDIPGTAVSIPEEPLPPAPTPPAAVELKSAAPAVASTPAAAPAADIATAAKEKDVAVKVTRHRSAGPAVNPTAMTAYQAFNAGDDAAAGRLYRQLLQAAPHDVDALLGLAALCARHDNSDDAAHYYLRVLELEPQNSVAQAGMTVLLGQADPLAAASRLKTLLAQQPDAAYLHAALGGIYAGQGQWADAQQAYFQAFRLDAAKAEHAFNLAVSMDQLGKPALALEYYQRARTLHAGAVDRQQLDMRIDQLRSATGQ